MSYRYYTKHENENFSKVIAAKGMARIEFWFNNPKTRHTNRYLAQRFKEKIEELGPKEAAKLLDYEKETYPRLLELRNCMFIEDEFERNFMKQPLVDND